MNNPISIGPGSWVSLTFALKLENGELVDSTGDDPAQFTVGDGSLLPGFETAMFGMKAGEANTFNIPAAQGFGELNPDNIRLMKRADFNAEIELSEGLIVSFMDPKKREMVGIVRRLVGEVVEVDLNHPLSGRDLIFDVDIKAIEQISNEILRA